MIRRFLMYSSCAIPRTPRRRNNREKGVGKETLIISPSVYKDVKQKRVVPVIMEREANGQVLVPTYLDGRLFVDLSIPESEAQGYEQLLRTLHGKPARKRPRWGSPRLFSRRVASLFERVAWCSCFDQRYSRIGPKRSACLPITSTDCSTSMLKRK
jgi:hypothetical protein